MAYYGMNKFMCHVLHYRKWTPFVGQYWCPVCEELRPGDPPDSPVGKLSRAVKKFKKEDKE